MAQKYLTLLRHVYCNLLRNLIISKMKYIKRIETITLDCGNTFEILYLECGMVLTLTQGKIGIFESEHDFNDPDYEPLIIECEKKENKLLN